MANIMVYVNPQIELMNSILYTSNHSNLIQNAMGLTQCQTSKQTTQEL